MMQCAVIADDLTGANATGALFSKMGFDAYTVMNMEQSGLKTMSDCDCLLYPTDSRCVKPEIAYDRVYNICRLLKNKNIKVYSKRIDSTLRGNLGSETDAMLDCLGADYTAFVVPCSPSSGRIIVGGYLLVDGIPLHKTNIAVDPGAFTATFSRRQITPSSKRGKRKILAVIGSVHPNTRTQLEELWSSQKTRNIFVHTRALIGTGAQKEMEIKRVVNEVLNDCEDDMIFTITGDGIYPEKRIDFRPYIESYQQSLEEVTGMIGSALAETAYQIFRADPAFQGLYTSGGDITAAVCQRFNIAGLHLIDEVLSFAAYGKPAKGDFEGIHIITKGGSQGDRDAIIQCITYLKEKLYI